MKKYYLIVVEPDPIAIESNANLIVVFDRFLIPTLCESLGDQLVDICIVKNHSTGFNVLTTGKTPEEWLEMTYTDIATIIDQEDLFEINDPLSKEILSSWMGK